MRPRRLSSRSTSFWAASGRLAWRRFSLISESSSSPSSSPSACSMARFCCRSNCSRCCLSMSSRVWEAISWRNCMTDAWCDSLASIVSRSSRVDSMVRISCCASSSMLCWAKLAMRYIWVTALSFEPMNWAKSWSPLSLSIRLAMRRATSSVSERRASTWACSSPPTSIDSAGISSYSTARYSSFDTTRPSRTRVTPWTTTTAPASPCSTRVTRQIVPTSWSSSMSGSSVSGWRCSTVIRRRSDSTAVFRAASDACRPTLMETNSSGKTSVSRSGRTGNSFNVVTEKSGQG